MNSKLYDKNINLFKKKDALTAFQLEYIHQFNELQFCKTTKGELNLRKSRYSITDYYHSQEGAADEANEIFEKEIDEKVPVVFFYGLGLGYIYEPLKEWLKKDPKRHLIILEDDLE